MTLQPYRTAIYSGAAIAAVLQPAYVKASQTPPHNAPQVGLGKNRSTFHICLYTVAVTHEGMLVINVRHGWDS